MQYRYRAADTLGQVQSGLIDANDMPDLERQLERLGLVLIDGKALRFQRRVSRRDLLLFCFHLEQLSSAGVPLLDSLRDLRDSATTPHFRAILACVVNDVDGGQSLSQALAMHPLVFKPVFVRLVAIGEISGELPQILQRLAETLKWQDELLAQARRVLLYPAFVAALVLAVLIFLLLYLVPQLAEFIHAMQQTLPLGTQLLLWLSNHLAYGLWLVPPLVIVAIFVLLGAYRSSRSYRLKLDRTLLGVPVVGTLWHKLIMARFACYFALLYRAGIPILDCIKACEGLSGNTAFAIALQRVQLQISAGSSVSHSFAQCQIFSPLMLRMLHVGEATGRLDETLQQVAYFYQRDIKESVERLQILIEPVLTVFLGLVLAWMMSSVLAPIFDLVGHLR